MYRHFVSVLINPHLHVAMHSQTAAEQLSHMLTFDGIDIELTNGQTAHRYTAPVNVNTVYIHTYNIYIYIYTHKYRMLLKQMYGL